MLWLFVFCPCNMQSSSHMTHKLLQQTEVEGKVASVLGAEQMTYLRGQAAVSALLLEGQCWVPSFRPTAHA